jgi:hypothetical protein
MRPCVRVGLIHWLLPAIRGDRFNSLSSRRSSA